MRLYKALVVLILLILCAASPSTALASEHLPIKGVGERHIVTAHSRQLPLPIGQTHDWVLDIRTLSGAVAQPQKILIGGGMRIHAHGLPSQPIIKRYLGEGQWLLSGLLFNMAGSWQVALRLTDETGVDDVVLSVSVGVVADPDTSANVSTPAHALPGWSSNTLQVLASMIRSELGPPRVNGSNRVADSSTAVALGEYLFHDTGLSADSAQSCASCHQPQRSFTDGLPTAGEGTRNTPSLLDSGYQQWLTADGRHDSLWSQALAPIESPQELAGDRMQALRHVANTPLLRQSYQNVFGELPLLAGLPDRASPKGDESAQANWNALSPYRRIEINTAFANLGKAIAAYERTLLSTESRFDRFVIALLAGDQAAADRWLNHNEQRGLQHFIDPANQCMNCHNGPLFSNRGFHNIGTGGIEAEGVPDFGRLVGIQAALLDPFNCRGAYSDAVSRDCDALQALQRFEIGSLMNGAFKVPGLRNVTRTAPYMHDGRFATLEEVIEFYRQPPEGRHELFPLPDLTDDDVRDIAAFLRSLDSLPNKQNAGSTVEHPHPTPHTLSHHGG